MLPLSKYTVNYSREWFYEKDMRDEDGWMDIITYKNYHRKWEELKWHDTIDKFKIRNKPAIIFTSWYISHKLTENSLIIFLLIIQLVNIRTLK